MYLINLKSTIHQGITLRQSTFYHDEVMGGLEWSEDHVGCIVDRVYRHQVTAGDTQCLVFSLALLPLLPGLSQGVADPEAPWCDISVACQAPVSAVSAGCVKRGKATPPSCLQFPGQESHPIYLHRSRTKIAPGKELVASVFSFLGKGTGGRWGGASY